MATAPQIRQAAIRDAEAEIRSILSKLTHQAGVTIEGVEVLVRPSTFEVHISGH
jgi:hypothetical protein